MNNKANPYPDMDLTCYIDDVEIEGRLISSERINRPKGAKLVFKGKQVSAIEERKFQFAAPVGPCHSRPSLRL
jgi:hypothetical protein